MILAMNQNKKRVINYNYTHSLAHKLRNRQISTLTFHSPHNQKSTIAPSTQHSSAATSTLHTSMPQPPPFDPQPPPQRTSRPISSLPTRAQSSFLSVFKLVFRMGRRLQRSFRQRRCQRICWIVCIRTGHGLSIRSGRRTLS